MLESKIEDYLVKTFQRLGAIVAKFEVPGRAGMPDRIIILPKGQVVFVELKKPGKAPRELQLHMHIKITDLQHCVYVIDSLEGVTKLYLKVVEVLAKK